MLAVVVIAEVTDSFDSPFFAARMVRLRVSATSLVGFRFSLVSQVLFFLGGGRGQREGQGHTSPSVTTLITGRSSRPRRASSTISRTTTFWNRTTVPVRVSQVRVTAARQLSTWASETMRRRRWTR